MTPGGGERKATATRGLAASLAQLGRTLVATLHSRAELLALEAAQERTRVVRIVVLAVAALLFFVLAMFTATLLVIAIFWDSYRLLAIGILTLVYLGIGAILLTTVRKEAARAARPFAATMEQLRKDRDVLL